MVIRERRAGPIAALLVLLAAFAAGVSPALGAMPDRRAVAVGDFDQVHFAGAASVRYAGSPPVEQRVSGVARVQRLPTIAI